MFCANGILFNHESPRRGATFVTRKITLGLANILAGSQNKIFLGNLKAKRDWGFAPDYVESMWKILQQKKPTDYVIGTGESNSVEEFVEKAFTYADLDWKEFIEIDQMYFRPASVNHLRANPNKAKKDLNWEPRVNFDELVKIMVDYDLILTGQEPFGEGLDILNRKGFDWTDNKITNG